MRNENGFGNVIYGAVGLVIFLILITSVVMPTVTGVSVVNTVAATTNCGEYGNTTCLIRWNDTHHSAYTYTTQSDTMNCGASKNASCGNGWDTGSVALWSILGLVVIASAIMFVVGKK